MNVFLEHVTFLSEDVSTSFQTDTLLCCKVCEEPRMGLHRYRESRNHRSCARTPWGACSLWFTRCRRKFWVRCNFLCGGICESSFRCLYACKWYSLRGKFWLIKIIYLWWVLSKMSKKLVWDFKFSFSSWNAPLPGRFFRSPIQVFFSWSNRIPLPSEIIKQSRRVYDLNVVSRWSWQLYVFEK